jgi:predicted restriction endonuclease
LVQEEKYQEKPVKREEIIIIIIILKFGDIKGETESTIVAAQDQEISTNYFKRKILKEEIESRCRLCKEYEETIDHLTNIRMSHSGKE